MQQVDSGGYEVAHANIEVKKAKPLRTWAIASCLLALILVGLVATGKFCNLVDSRRYARLPESSSLKILLSQNACLHVLQQEPFL
jgi:hypothetical protein